MTVEPRPGDRFERPDREDHRTNTVEDAAAFERDREGRREVRIGARRVAVDEVPDEREL
jgi:hypothetical protein